MSVPQPGHPLDTLGRPLHDLRISVMDRLSFDGMLRLSRLFAGLGVRKMRLTGGEPLLRANLSDLVGDLTTI